MLLFAAFFWPKVSYRADDDFTASSAGKTTYKNMACGCIGFEVPQNNCLSCTQYTDCYGIPISCGFGCRKQINGTWQDIYCSDGSLITTPKDKESCESQGGRWGSIGLSPEEVCVMPTTDAGKVCYDSSECQAACVATLTQGEYDWIVRHHFPVFKAGTCTAWKGGVGCNAYVKNGVVNQILCVD